MFKLNNIKSPFGSRHSKKRKGLGIGSGVGKTAGRGHKGQKARSGGGIPDAFEGGQVPLQRRSPKVGFRSRTKKYRYSLNIGDLARYEGQDLTLKDLLPKHLAGERRMKVSIMGHKAPKAFPKSLELHRVSPTAKKILEEASVSLKILETPVKRNIREEQKKLRQNA